MEMSVRRRAPVIPSQRGESVGIIAGRGLPRLGSAVSISGIGRGGQKSWGAAIHAQYALLDRRSLAWIIPILLVLGHGAAAVEKRPKDANTQLGSAPALRTADANDPNESWWTKWDAIVKDPNDPNELLAAKWEAVVRILQVQDLDQKLKERIIDKIVSPTFDFPLMGQLAVGRTHWPKLNSAQREKFVELFTKRLKALYLEKTALYKNQKTVLKPAERKKNLVQIPMTLISEDGEIALLYKLRLTDEPDKSKAKGRWRIYDVEINGVSILLTYRSQFDDILRRGTVQDLLSQLEKSPSQ
jgi:phospholipid transport system substrate-binding protein